MISIFDYTDYRKFLRDRYAEEAAHSGRSYLWVAENIGFSSKGYFTQVLQGKSNLSVAKVAKFADLFGLKKKRRNTFPSLFALTKPAAMLRKSAYSRRSYLLNEHG